MPSATLSKLWKVGNGSVNRLLLVPRAGRVALEAAYRVDIELEVEILKFDDGTPGQHWRDSECIFKARGKSLTFARQLLSSLERIRINLGPDGCQRAGGRPFPAKEQERLRAAIKTCAGTMRYLADYAIKSGHKSEKSGWNA